MRLRKRWAGGGTIAFLLLFCASASAQVAPGTFTTVKSTSTAATSVCVGCPTGSTTPAANSGITAATLVLPSGVPSSTTNKLYSSAGALFFNGLALATGGSINGTANSIAKFTAATVLGDSIITDTGTTVTVAGALNANGNIMTGTNGVEGNAIINGPAGSNRVILWRTAGVARWFAYATSVAETGANAGSNWRLDAYNDAGSVIGSAIFVTRSSLAVALGGALAVTGTTALSDATTVATSLQLTGAAPVYLANVNNGYLYRNAANGATLFSITNAGVGAFTGAYTHTGVTTFTAQPVMSSLTASQAVFTDGSKGLVSNAITGSGNVVMSASPTLTGTIGAAAMTLSSTLGVAGVVTSTVNSATFALDFQGANGGGITASNAAGALRFYTGSSTLRWGINAAGDWTLGASSHIADSNGTPGTSAGFGSVPVTAGTDYAFTVTHGSGAGNTGGTVTFGHTFNAAPVCLAQQDGGIALTVTTSTTTVAVAMPSSTYTGKVLWVLCRGY